MKKIKIYSSFNESELAKLVNDFIELETTHVYDVKFTTHVIPKYSGLDHEDYDFHSEPKEVFNTMIIYESEVN